MDPSTINMLFNTVPWGIVAYFLVRVINKVDQGIDLLNDFKQTLVKFESKLELFQKDKEAIHEAMKNRLDHHDDTIELCRSRIHDLGNTVTALSLRFQIQEKKMGES